MPEHKEKRFGDAGSEPINFIHKFLRESPLVDTHNDAAWQIRKFSGTRLDEVDFTSPGNSRNPCRHTSIEQLRDGGGGAVFWAVYLPPTMQQYELMRGVDEQIDLIMGLTRKYSDKLEFATSAGDIRSIHGTGKIASLMGIEGGHMMNNALDTLRYLYERGARYMTLTYTKNTVWADSANDGAVHNGLTDFGTKVVAEMNRLGMLVDLSHVSDATMHDALVVSRAPVIFSHSAVRALTNNVRNVPDDVLKELESNGGVIMVPFVPYFVSNPASEHATLRMDKADALTSKYPNEPVRVEEGVYEWEKEHPAPTASLSDVADHIDYVANAIGIDHVGIGSDFDGYSGVTEGLEDASRYPYLLLELLDRGYSEDDIKKVAGENVLRVMQDAEDVARD